MPVTLDEVRAVAAELPRAYEVVVRGFPKEWRPAAVESEPEKFSLPGESDLRFNWIHVRLAALDADEMRDLVEDAWTLCVPRYVAEEYAASRGYAV